tara:strand:+ start:345 stop:695 length:351 start_codon:yes stop_codon:yes gene_type:complete
MAKKQINYSDLSNKELELLKNKYIDLKVKSMNFDDLKEFVTENISLQIKNTIGNDEELEAWQEMEKFFKDEFENIILNIQIKTRQTNLERTNLNIGGIKLNPEDKGEEKKLDMWED